MQDIQEHEPRTNLPLSQCAQGVGGCFLPFVNGTERCPVFGKIRCPIFCTLRDSNPDCYPEAALPSSSFTATLSIPALRLVLSR